MLPELLILLRPPRGQGRAVLSGWAERGLGCRRGFGLQLTQHWDLSDLVIVEPENVSWSFSARYGCKCQPNSLFVLLQLCKNNVVK